MQEAEEAAERSRRTAERRAKMTPEEIEAEDKRTEDFLRRYVFGYGGSE